MQNKADRRTTRTRELLDNAFISLMMEKPYHALTVQDIVDRANVGRSTFYAHYQHKDDLLANQFQRLIHGLTQDVALQNQTNNPLFPSLGLFRHVQQHYQLYKAVVVWGPGIEFVSKTMQAYLSQNIENRLAVLSTGQQPTTIPLPVLSHYVAGAFLTLLKWWLDNNMIYSPEQMDELFQQLVLPGVQTALGVSL